MQYRSYPEYLESGHWTFTRKKILERDSYKCVVCNNKADQVHHINYRNWIDVQDSDLMSVCGICHNRIHSAIDKGYISLNNKGSLQKTLNGLKEMKENKPLSFLQNKEKCKIVLQKDILLKWDTLHPNQKKRICGILKKRINHSFVEWEGDAISIRKLNAIKQSIKWNSKSRKNRLFVNQQSINLPSGKLYRILINVREWLPEEILNLLNKIGTTKKRVLSPIEASQVEEIRVILKTKYNIRHLGKFFANIGTITKEDFEKLATNSRITVDNATQNG